MLKTGFIKKSKKYLFAILTFFITIAWLGMLGIVGFGGLVSLEGNSFHIKSMLMYIISTGIMICAMVFLRKTSFYSSKISNIVLNLYVLFGMFSLLLRLDLIILSFSAERKVLNVIGILLITLMNNIIIPASFSISSMIRKNTVQF